MLQDFSFKILHKPRLKHTNVDALNKNLVRPTTEDDDFSEEIQDIRSIQTNTPRAKDEILFIQSYGKGSEWLGFRRQKKSFYNIMNIVLVSIIGVMPKVISSICLMLY